MKKLTPLNFRRLSPQGAGHYFFGYYDVPAFSQNDQLHLAHRVQFCDRLPRESDIAEIGFIERDKKTFTPFAETTAWNFQQGAMLQWLPTPSGNEIIYNTRHKSAFGSCILNVANGAKQEFPIPIANIDPHGRFALSINFSRMFDFRPGYGYAGITDPWHHIDRPEDDGIYLLDFRDGSVNLVLSLQEIWSFTRQWLPQDNQKLLVNHITFNPSGTRFVALVRYFPTPERRRATVVITANIDGSAMRAMKEEYSMASHYHWKNDETLLIYAEGHQGAQLYEWNDITNVERVIDPDFFVSDGHCSYSPDRRFILYDSYPDAERYQKLSLYDQRNLSAVKLGKFYSYDQGNNDIRCDLHPRWNHAGDIISLDSNHEGSRHIYELGV